MVWLITPLLQFGHGEFAVENEVGHRRLHRGQLASIRPRRIRRGEPGWIASVSSVYRRLQFGHGEFAVENTAKVAFISALTIASIRPRRIRRGERAACAGRSTCGRRRFNSATAN